MQFLPEMHDLNVIMRKHQTNPNGRHSENNWPVKSGKSRKDGRTIPMWRLKRQDNQPQSVILNWIPLQEQLWSHKSAETQERVMAPCRWQNPVGVDGRQEREKTSWSWWSLSLNTGRTPSSTWRDVQKYTGRHKPRYWVHIRIKGTRASEPIIGARCLCLVVGTLTTLETPNGGYN